MTDTNRPSLIPGMAVTPHIELKKKLGEGGMGSVWIAEHRALATEVAVKFILPERDGCEMLLERFAREAKLSSRIKNPHVVQVFDYGVASSGAAYIVMELLDGESLDERLDACGALSPAETGAVVAQVGRVLAKAHELDIVHRDLKPANLFLTDVGYDVFVKVLDFGIAKELNRVAPNLTASTAVVGTPLYMSPEALKGRGEADLQLDLWALAAVAYECLTGQRPFDGVTFAEQTLLVHEGRYAPASTFAGVPRSFDGFFDRAFARRPADRFASAKEMVAAYQRAMMASAEPSRVVVSAAPGPDADRARGTETTFDGSSLETVTSVDALPTTKISSKALVATLVGLAAIARIVATGSAPEPVPMAASTAATVTTSVAVATLAQHEATEPEAPMESPAATATADREDDVPVDTRPRSPHPPSQPATAPLERPVEQPAAEPERAFDPNAVEYW